MIKFERLSKDAKATIVRNDAVQPVYLGMVVTSKELETLTVSSGTVLYTVDEEKVIEVHASTKTQEPQPELTSEPVTVQEPVVEQKKPVIVRPAPRNSKK